MFRVSAIILVLVSISLSQQAGELKQGSVSEATSKIGKTREVMGFSSQTTSFLVKLREVSTKKIDESAPARIRGKEFTAENQNEISIMSPFKICMIFDSKVSLFEGSNKVTSIWNEKKYKQTSEFEINGQRTIRDTTAGVSTENLNNVLSQNSIKKIDIKPMDTKMIYCNELWTMVFPLILTNPIENNAKLEFIGRAKAGEQIANLIRTKSPNGDTIQLLFDEKTNLLLMMISKGKNPFGDYEDRYYYSNHEKKANVLIPTKVKIERKFTPSNGNPLEITYRYIDVVGFEVNPEFKKDLFDIK